MSMALILIVGHADSNLESSDMALVGRFWFAGIARVWQQNLDSPLFDQPSCQGMT